ncbi:MAG: hypothetical protein JXR96_16295 [Deltaproteobacteria bacterium]|nr:hypothetical protein [Deltaproteobacteria bacterium]
MGVALPGWVVDDRESVRREAEPFRDMSPEQRLALVAAACRAMMRMPALRDDRERVLAHEDPLPSSSVRALARLRRESAREAGCGDRARPSSTPQRS